MLIGIFCAVSVLAVMAPFALMTQPETFDIALSMVTVTFGFVWPWSLVFFLSLFGGFAAIIIKEI